MCTKYIKNVTQTYIFLHLNKKTINFKVYKSYNPLPLSKNHYAIYL